MGEGRGVDGGVGGEVALSWTVDDVEVETGSEATILNASGLGQSF